ncbi:HAD hydrolase-like protein [Acidobacteriota bacterium]
MKIENILFDLDGTLTDPQSGITKSIQYALEKLGKPVPEVDDLLWCIGPPLLGSLRKLLAADADKAETALSFYRERFNAVGKFENEVYPGIPETLTGLSRQGFNLFVATSKPYVFANDILSHFDLLRFFKRVYGSELDGALGDKGELIAYILKRGWHPQPIKDDAAEVVKTSGIKQKFVFGAHFWKVLAKNTMMVGDRSHDILGAKKNGVYSLGVTYGYGTKEELVGSGADYIVDSPQEIMEIAKNPGAEQNTPAGGEFKL